MVPVCRDSERERERERKNERGKDRQTCTSKIGREGGIEEREREWVKLHPDGVAIFVILFHFLCPTHYSYRCSMDIRGSLVDVCGPLVDVGGCYCIFRVSLMQ